MLCSNCGNPLDPNDKFCKSCGTPINMNNQNPVNMDTMNQGVLTPQMPNETMAQQPTVEPQNVVTPVEPVTNVPPVTPEPVMQPANPEPVVPPVTPEVNTNVTPVVESTPVSSVVEPMASAPVTNEVVPNSEGVIPQVQVAEPNANTVTQAAVNTSDNQKKNNTLFIVIVIVLVVVIIGLVLFFVLSKDDNSTTSTNNDTPAVNNTTESNNTTNEQTSQTVATTNTVTINNYEVPLPEGYVEEEYNGRTIYFSSQANTQAEIYIHDYTTYNMVMNSKDSLKNSIEKQGISISNIVEKTYGGSKALVFECSGNGLNVMYSFIEANSYTMVEILAISPTASVSEMENSLLSLIKDAKYKGTTSFAPTDQVDETQAVDGNLQLTNMKSFE